MWLWAWARFCWLSVSSCWVNVWTFCTSQVVFCLLMFSWTSILDAWKPGILVRLLFPYFRSGPFIVNSVVFWSCGSGPCNCCLLKYPGRESVPMTLSQAVKSSWWLKELALWVLLALLSTWMMFTTVFYLEWVVTGLADSHFTPGS